MIIIEITHYDKGKYLVTFDDGTSIYLYRSEINELKLKENDDIDIEKFDHILRDIIGKRATRRAMHILEKRDKTEKQLRDKLRENNYPEISINIAIDYVKSYGYIDDERFCSNYISYRVEKQSRSKISMDLINKGIDKELISRVYDEYYEEEFTDNQILKLLEKKHYMDIREDKNQVNKIVQSIMRKGYSYSKIRAVINKIDDYQDFGDDI